MSQTFHDLVWPIERPIERIDHRRQEEQRLSRIAAREELRQRKAAKRSALWARAKSPVAVLIWSLVILALIALALGGAQWLVGL